MTAPLYRPGILHRVILGLPERPRIQWPTRTADRRHQKMRIQYVMGADCVPPKQSGEYQVVHRVTGEVLARTKGDEWIYTKYMAINPDSI